MEKISAKLNSVKPSHEVCSGRFENHYLGSMPGCRGCTQAVRPDGRYYCTNPPMEKHCLGEEDECLPCKTFNLSTIIVGEPRPKFGKLQGQGAIKGLKADSYVKQPAGSESGLRL